MDVHLRLLLEEDEAAFVDLMSSFRPWSCSFTAFYNTAHWPPLSSIYVLETVAEEEDTIKSLLGTVRVYEEVKPHGKVLRLDDLHVRSGGHGLSRYMIETIERMYRGKVRKVQVISTEENIPFFATLSYEKEKYILRKNLPDLEEVADVD